MIEWRGIWFPDGEIGIIEWMARNGHERAGRPTYQYHKYEAALGLAKRRRIAIDIGAHVGLWSQVMALDFDQVHAFEPVTEHLDCWQRNMQDIGNAVLHPFALGNEEKLVSMVSVNGNSGMTHIGQSGQSAQLKRLDTLNLENVDFIKVDYEGYELFALQGGEETLKRCRPVICVEQKPGSGLRYTFYDTAAVSYLKSLGATLHGEIQGDFIFSWPEDDAE